MMKGKIKFYNRAKDFGFITAEDGQEYYFNASSLLSPVENDTVSFIVQDTGKGAMAKKVKLESGEGGGSCRRRRFMPCVIGSISILVIGGLIGFFIH